MIRRTIFTIFPFLWIDRASSFSSIRFNDNGSSRGRSASILHVTNDADDGNIISMDVSDLGVTMDDLNKPLPNDMAQGIVTSGYESTSRLPDVNDDGCMWVENQDTMEVTLSIPGLRGQPPAALSLLTATNTISITAFGRVVWSCILRKEVEPNTMAFETFEGPDMTPVIQLTVEKSSPEDGRWGGFILQIGEDSIL